MANWGWTLDGDPGLSHRGVWEALGSAGSGDFFGGTC